MVTLGLRDGKPRSGRGGEPRSNPTPERTWRDCVWYPVNLSQREGGHYEHQRLHLGATAHI